MSNNKLKDVLREFSKEEIEKALIEIDGETAINQFRSRLCNWQNEIIDYDRNHLVCCAERGVGTTFTIASSILINRPKTVVYKGEVNGLDVLCEKFEEIYKMSSIGEDIEVVRHHAKDNIKIEWKDGSITRIYNFNTRGITNNVDYLYFDGFLPYAVPIDAKHVFSFVNSKNVNFVGLSNVLPTCTIKLVE